MRQAVRCDACGSPNPSNRGEWPDTHSGALPGRDLTSVPCQWPPIKLTTAMLWMGGLYTGLWVHSVVRWGCVEANSLRRTRSRAHLLVPIESPGIDCAASMAKPPSRGRPGTTALEPTWYLGSSKSQGGWVTSVADVRVRDSPGVFLSRTDTGSPCHQDSMG